MRYRQLQILELHSSDEFVQEMAIAFDLQYWRHQCILCILLAYVVGLCCGWNLENLKLNRNDYRIIHVSVFYVRAFLCIDSVVHLNKARRITGRQPKRCK